MFDYLEKDVLSQGYASRSEFIRSLIRQRMVDEKWEESEDCIGVLSIIYDHHHNELSDKMVESTRTSAKRSSLYARYASACPGGYRHKRATIRDRKIASEDIRSKGVKNAQLSKTAVV